MSKSYLCVCVCTLYMLDTFIKSHNENDGVQDGQEDKEGHPYRIVTIPRTDTIHNQDSLSFWKATTAIRYLSGVCLRTRISLASRNLACNQNLQKYKESRYLASHYLATS